MSTVNKILLGCHQADSCECPAHDLHLPMVPDRIFTRKLGLSQSLMVQEGTHNLNVTLKGYPKKLCGLFGQKAHKTQRITIFHPQRACLSKTLTNQGQTYNPKCKPKWLPNETQRFSWDGSTHSTHNTAKVSDWLIFQNHLFFIGHDTDVNNSIPI